MAKNKKMSGAKDHPIISTLSPVIYVREPIALVEQSIESQTAAIREYALMQGFKLVK